MDCSAFRHHHLAYLDDTLPGELVIAAERHRAACVACAAHDTLVRRALMLARNCPTIEPSAGFETRLQARLQAAMRERCDGLRRDVASDDDMVPRDGWSDGSAWDLTVARVREQLREQLREHGRSMATAALVAAVSAGATLGYTRSQARGYDGAGLTESVAAAPAPVRPVAVRRAAAGAAVNSEPARAARWNGAAWMTPVSMQAAGRAGYGAGAPVAGASVASALAHRPIANGARADSAAATSEMEPPMYIALPPMGLEASALVAPASNGVPVWAAALLAGEAPAELMRGANAPAVRLVNVAH